MRPRATPAAKDIDRRFQEAVALHQRGDNAGAAQRYEQLRVEVPDHPELLHLHGTALAQLGRPAEALPALERSLTLRPQHAPTLDVARACHVMIGEAQLADGQNDAARTAFQKALAIAPHSPDAIVGLATALVFLGLRSDAITQLQTCVARHPEFIRGHMVLGTVLGQERRFTEAEVSVRAALKIQPSFAEGHYLLARTLYRQGRAEEAEAAYKRTIALGLRSPPVLTECAEILTIQDRLDEADAMLQEALAASPQSADALTALGQVEEHRGALDKAVALHNRALAADPNAANVYINRGTAYRLKGAIDAALADFDRALTLKPAMPVAIANRGATLLSIGRLSDGWADFKSRVRAEDGYRDLSGTQPWDGTPLDGKRVLVWTDSGLGDEIMAASLLPELLARAAHCTLLCSPRLIGLFKRAFPTATVISSQTEITGHFDARLPLLDAAQWLRPNFEAFPNRTHFLTADVKQTLTMRDRYGADERPLVGISWRSASMTSGRMKTLPLTAWANILNTPGLRFVSLQYGNYDDDVRAARATSGADIIVDQTVDPVRDVDQFAAQVNAMDLVISASNTTVHLAGALGKPTWVLVPEGPGAHWYWFQKRSDSPWYPALRLFRQTRPGDWSDVVASVARDLQAYPVAARDPDQAIT
jgi:tetratricopeptide (TPR) repeat protein/ADP-heptose:LPS heptosyltransferase